MLLSFLSKTVRAGVVAAAAVLAIAGAAQTASAALPAEDHFPLTAGNRWVLRHAASGQSKEIRVEARQGTLAYVTGMLDQDAWYGLTSAAPNSVYVWNPDAGAWHAFARFGYITTPWRFDLSSGGCDLFDAVWARGSGSGQAGTTIAVAAGSFPGSRELQLRMTPAANVRCAAPASKVFFAKGVGPVRIVMASGEVYDLETAVVGGRAFPAPTASGIQATLAAPKPIWINQPNTIRCITTPCPSNEVTAKVPFTFTVTNNTSAAVTFQFSSGQQFDIELLNAQGRVVKAWSDGRAFTMALTSRTLQPRQSMTFTADLELKDRNGMQLDGTFTAKARLTTASWSQPVFNVSATSSVVCKIQP